MGEVRGSSVKVTEESLDAEPTGIVHPEHRRLLAAARVEATQDPEVIGLMLMAFVARGDALPGSDQCLFLRSSTGSFPS